MFFSAVASKCQATVFSNCFPEITSGFSEFFISIHLSNTLKSYKFWDLCIRVLIIQVIDTLRQRMKYLLMRIPFSCFQIFLLSSYLIGISINLRHTTMFHVQHRLHLLMGKIFSKCYTPVTKIKKHFFSFLTIGIKPGIS